MVWCLYAIWPSETNRQKILRRGQYPGVPVGNTSSKIWARKRSPIFPLLIVMQKKHLPIQITSISSALRMNLQYTVASKNPRFLRTVPVSSYCTIFVLVYRIVLLKLFSLFFWEPFFSPARRKRHFFSNISTRLVPLKARLSADVFCCNLNHPRAYFVHGKARIFLYLKNIRIFRFLENMHAF